MFHVSSVFQGEYDEALGIYDNQVRISVNKIFEIFCLKFNSYFDFTKVFQKALKNIPAEDLLENQHKGKFKILMFLNFEMTFPACLMLDSYLIAPPVVDCLSNGIQ